MKSPALIRSFVLIVTSLLATSAYAHQELKIDPKFKTQKETLKLSQEFKGSKNHQFRAGSLQIKLDVNQRTRFVEIRDVVLTSKDLSVTFVSGGLCGDLHGGGKFPLGIVSIDFTIDMGGQTLCVQSKATLAIPYIKLTGLVTSQGTDLTLLLDETTKASLVLEMEKQISAIMNAAPKTYSGIQYQTAFAAMMKALDNNVTQQFDHGLGETAPLADSDALQKTASQLLNEVLSQPLVMTLEGEKDHADFDSKPALLFRNSETQAIHFLVGDTEESSPVKGDEVLADDLSFVPAHLLTEVSEMTKAENK